MKNNDLHEFHPLNIEIQERPINPLGKYLLLAILSILIITISWLFLGKIDIVISSTGTVIPNGEVKNIQSLDNGEISNIYVKEGSIVKKGDILMQINPSVIEYSLDAKEKSLKILRIQRDRLFSLINIGNFEIKDNDIDYLNEFNIFLNQKDFFKNNIDNYNLQINQIEKQLRILKIEKNDNQNILINMNNKLNKMKNVIDIIAKNDYYELEKECFSLKSKVNIYEIKILELNDKLNELNKDLLKFKNEFIDSKYKELNEKKVNINELESEINKYKFQNKKQTIISPVNGTIYKIYNNTIGGIVTAAEKLIMIVPNDIELIVKANVLNKDIGFLKNNLDVKIKSDTYNFQKYGILNGSVDNISSYSIEDQKLGSIYEVKVKLKDNKLSYKDEIYELKAGMSVLVEVKIGKRRIIDFFIYPLVQYLDEGLSVK